MRNLAVGDFERFLVFVPPHALLLLLLLLFTFTFPASYCCYRAALGAWPLGASARTPKHRSHRSRRWARRLLRSTKRHSEPPPPCRCASRDSRGGPRGGRGSPSPRGASPPRSRTRCSPPSCWYRRRAPFSGTRRRMMAMAPRCLS